MESSELIIPPLKEILSDNQGKYKNLFGEDTRQRGYKSIGGNTESTYEPQTKSLVNEEGYSIINPDYFKKETLLIPSCEKTTKMIVPLNRIIALDTTKEIDSFNNDTNRLPWEIRSHISVNKFRELIKENKFNFDDIGGLYCLELPGNYFIATGGRHRLTAMFLEGLSEVKLEVYKIKDPKEFYFTNRYSEYKVQKSIDEGEIKGKIKEDSYQSKKLVLDEDIVKNPLQLFDGRVSDELIDVLSQTL